GADACGTAAASRGTGRDGSASAEAAVGGLRRFPPSLLPVPRPTGLSMPTLPCVNFRAAQPTTAGLRTERPSRLLQCTPSRRGRADGRNLAAKVVTGGPAVEILLDTEQERAARRLIDQAGTIL